MGPRVYSREHPMAHQSERQAETSVSNVSPRNEPDMGQVQEITAQDVAPATREERLEALYRKNIIERQDIIRGIGRTVEVRELDGTLIISEPSEDFPSPRVYALIMLVFG